MSTASTALGRLFSYLICDVASSKYTPLSIRRRILVLKGWEIDKTATVMPGHYSSSNNTRLAPGARLGRDAYLGDVAGIYIGRDTGVAARFCGLTRTHPVHDTLPRRRTGPAEDIDRPIVIEEGCWLATGVTVLPGVTIARGCVIAAGSVVTRSTAPDGVYAGAPAKRIRDLPPSGAGPDPA